MIRNYLKTAFRVLLRQKSYSLINIGGLAIGMAVCMLILTYVFHELSYDRFHEHSENIYRLGVDADFGGKAMNLSVSASAMGPTLVKDYPEVLAATRLNHSGQKFLMEIEDRKFYQSNILFADSCFFQVFSFELVRGNRDEALMNRNSIVLTESVAEKFFGNENALGKTIRFNGVVKYTVTGIMKDVPGNSHLQFDILMSNSFPDNWGRISLYTYLLLEPNTDIDRLQAKFPDFQDRYMSDLKEMDITFNLFLQALTDIHLYSKLEYEIDPSGDITYVYLFSAVALFILFIACINYMNLASARSFRRAKEVGLRKVHGALRKQLIRQFIGESVLFSSIAFFLAVVILESVLSEFNTLIGTNGSQIYNNFSNILLFFVVVSVFVGIFAGSYPAFYMSSFSPIAALKGDKIKGKKKSLLRNILVVLQFTIAVALIICTGVIYEQLNFIKNKDLGFDLENRVVIPVRNANFQSKIKDFKNEFKQLSLVENVSVSNAAPSLSMSGSGYVPEGLKTTAPLIIYSFVVDNDYIETLDMEIVEGRNFSEEFGTDSAKVIVNERLCKVMNWDEPLGKNIKQLGSENPINFKIVGVIKDFHFKSLLNEVEPFMLHYLIGGGDMLLFELKDGYYNEALKQIENKWLELTNNTPFDYISLKENYEAQYLSYLRMGKLFTVFTLIAIFVACIGLFGLTSFLTEMRTKEIGIRKVNGASVFNILRLLNADFLKWVLIANVIACPIAWYFMNEWLNEFSYQIHLRWYYFVFGAVLSIIVALLTVSYQSIKSATRNPVDSLRYE